MLFAVAALGASPLLKLNLYARGYGLLFLASVVVAIALLRYLETGKQRHLVLFSIAVFCGGWSVPSFLLFAGVLMLFLFGQQAVQRKSWLAVGIAGAVVLGVTIVAYLPAIDYYRDEEAVASMFGTERQYGRWGAILDTFNSYLTIRTSPVAQAFTSLAVLVILLGIGLPLARIRWKDPVWLTSALLLLGVISFFLICRALGTPFVRTAAFIVAPVGLVIAFGTRNLLPQTSAIRTGLTVAFAAFVLIAWIPQVRSLELVPTSSWRETVALAERLAPEITRVHVKIRDRDFARLYLSGACQSDKVFDESAFTAGQQLLIDANYYEPPEKRFNAIGLSDHVVQIDVPQERGIALKSNWQRLAFVAPHGRGFEGIRVGPKDKTTSGKTFQIDAKTGDESVEILYLYSLAPNLGKPPMLKILRESGSWKTAELDGERLGNLYIFPVSIPPGTTVKISYYLSEPADEIPGLSIWAASPHR